MDPRKLFYDQRLNTSCAYCGLAQETRDHVPGKVFLDEPYPENLGIVMSCDRCNNEASKDEVYVACLIDCIISGSADPDKLQRNGLGRTLAGEPSLRKRIAASCVPNPDGSLIWNPERERVKKIMLKLARGHVAYDLADPKVEEPDSFSKEANAKWSWAFIQKFPDN